MKLNRSYTNGDSLGRTLESDDPDTKQLKSKIRDLYKEKELLRKKTEQFETDYHDVNYEKTRMQKTIDDLEKENTALKALIRQLKDEKIELEITIRTMTACMDETKEKWNTFSTKLCSYFSELTKASTLLLNPTHTMSNLQSMKLFNKLVGNIIKNGDYFKEIESIGRWENCAQTLAFLNVCSSSRNTPDVSLSSSFQFDTSQILEKSALVNIEEANFVHEDDQDDVVIEGRNKGKGVAQRRPEKQLRSVNSQLVESEIGNEGTGNVLGELNDKSLNNGVNSLKISLARPNYCLLYTSPSPRDGLLSRMPSSA